MKLADEKGFKSIGMPAISAGIFGFPKQQCAHIITEEIAGFVTRETAIKEIDLYLMDTEIIEFFSEELDHLERGA